MKKTALSQFKKDLADSSAGLDSDLYKTISPMVAIENRANLKGPAADRIKMLEEQLRQGVVGSQYLTGAKHNTGETFYDEHPAQAVITDALKNGPILGAGLAAAGVGANLLRQGKNMRMTEPARMSSDKNPLDATNFEELLNPQKGPVREDISKVFGSFESNPSTRLKIIDQLNNKLDPSNATDFHGAHKTLLSELQGHQDLHSTALGELQNKLQAAKSPKEIQAIKTEMAVLEKQLEHSSTATKQKINNLFSEAKKSAGASSLGGYVKTHEGLRRSRDKGGFKSYIGESLNSPGGGKIREFLRKYLAPGQDQAIGDLFEKNKVTGASPHYNEELVREILKHHRGGADLMSDAKGRAFMASTLKNLGDPKHQASGVMKALAKHKLPLAAGGALAAGSMGIYPLLKAIQNQIYPKDKTNEWKRTLLQSRGDFDAADQIQ